jgi:hypothetical protein
MKNMHARHPLLALVVGILAAGCSAAPPNAADLDAKAEPITGGDLASSPFSSVVRINNNCLATKIGDHRFLTSGTCLSTLVTSTNPNPTLSMSKAADGVSDPVQVTVFKSSLHPSVVNTGLYPNTDPTVAYHSNYDAGIIDVNESTTFPQSPINAIPFDDFFGGNLLGYGCDAVHANHDSKKQVAGINARSFAQVRGVYDTTTHSTDYLLDHYRHYVSFGVPGGPSLCGSGDIGGPTFRNSNNAIAGISSSYDGVLSHITRTANIKRWIEDPSPNTFFWLSGGFLLNAQTAKCITPRSGLAYSAICSAPSQDTDVQYWNSSTEAASGQPTYWRLWNGNTRQCLTRMFNGQLGTAACDNSDAQRWVFQLVQTYAPFSVPGQGQVVEYYRIASKALPGECVQPQSLQGEPQLVTAACDDNSSAQRWLFTR